MVTKNSRRQKQGTLKLSQAKNPISHDKRLKIKDIYFGSIDATDELEIGSFETSDIFYESFYIPEGLVVSEYLQGEKFFVYGLKGTGKTSFLRYLEEKIIRDNLSIIRPELFRFRTEFPKEIYEDVKEAFLNGTELESEERGSIYRCLDYENVWEYIILKRICEISNSKKGLIFEDDDNFSIFTKFIYSISSSEIKKKLYRFLPNIRSGKVKISASPSAEFDFEFDNPDNKEISFHKYTKKAIELYRSLSPVKENPFYLLFDEIDPRTGSGILLELDCILIRDLITAIKYINSLHSYETKSVYLIAAIRSEVLNKIKSLGKEVHKRLEQFGYSMNWGESGAIDINHPLIQMICKKIALSEKRKGLLSAEIGDYQSFIWPRYFRKNNQEQLEPKYILDLSWHRPRDFVRLFEFCKKKQGDAYNISESLISRVQKQYSNSSWMEISHHLTVSIDPFSIEGVEQVLTGINKDFLIGEFEEILISKSKKLTSVERLLSKNKPADILLDLYRTGALGTIYKSRNRFVFRGDNEPDFQGKFCVHKGLYSHFSIYSRSRKNQMDIK